MMRSTRTISQADDPTPPPPSLEEQFAGFHTVLQNVASRLTSINARLETNEVQLKDQQQAATILTDKVTQLGCDIQKLQSTATSIPSDSSQSIAHNTDKLVPSPYQHPHARQFDTGKPPSSHSPYQDNSRKNDDWCQPNTTPRWVPPRAEMTKFDSSSYLIGLRTVNIIFIFPTHPIIIKYKLLFLF
jgi:hypothetical protein